MSQNSAVASPTGAPSCDVDFFGDDYLRDPVRGYHKMLAAGPVVWLPRNGLHAICGYSAITTALKNYDVFVSGKGVSINDDVNEFLIGSTLNSDPPNHDATRAITFAPLTPRALEDVRTRIEQEANFIANEVVAKVEFDAVEDLATHLPLAIVRDLVGLGADGKDHMLKWAGSTFEMMGDPRDRRDAALSGMAELRQFLNDPGMLSTLSPHGWASRATSLAIEAGIEPGRAVSLMRDYIAPSLDTTISAISYGIKLFADSPEQWTKLRADRSLMRNAIEEIVRLSTPIKTLSRLVDQDVELDGVQLPAGTRVMMIFGAANRDPARFENPDDFDIERKMRGHVGFGHGVHVCLGMHLARLEMDSLFNALADHIERFELTGPPVAALNSVIHALEHLPVRVTT